MTESIVIRVQPEAGIENRMMIGNPRLKSLVVVRLAESARMGQLQSDEQIVRRARGFLVSLEQQSREGRRYPPGSSG